MSLGVGLPDRVLARLLKESSKDIGGILDTTRDMVRDTIREGIEAGDAPAQLGVRLQEAAAFDEYRAETVARTETAVILNRAAIESYREYGITHVTVSDGDDDEACAAADGQVWTLEEAEANPIEHPNCVRDFAPIIGEPPAPAAPEAEREVAPLTFQTGEAADAWARAAYGDSEFVKFQGQVPTSGVAAELPPAELKAIQDYSTSGYHDLNRYLRGLEPENFTPAELEARFVGPMDSALARQPLPEDVLLTRTTEYGAFPTADLDSLVGQTFTERGYMSTALGPSPRLGNYPVEMHITAPRGTPAFYVESVSRISGEHEMVLGRGLNYRIDRIVHTGRTPEFYEDEIVQMFVTVLP